MPIASYFWIGAIVLFAVIEAATVSLVSIWFIGGAVAAFIAALCGASTLLQLTLFVAVSAVLLALMRPLLRNRLMPKRTATNADRLVGQEALVCEAVDNLAETGAIRINGVIWMAKSESGDPIPADTLVRILRIEGAKVYVEPAAVTAASK